MISNKNTQELMFLVLVLSMVLIGSTNSSKTNTVIGVEVAKTNLYPLIRIL